MDRHLPTACIPGARSSERDLELAPFERSVGGAPPCACPESGAERPWCEVRERSDGAAITGDISTLHTEGGCEVLSPLSGSANGTIPLQGGRFSLMMGRSSPSFPLAFCILLLGLASLWWMMLAGELTGSWMVLSSGLAMLRRVFAGPPSVRSLSSPLPRLPVPLLSPLCLSAALLSGPPMSFDESEDEDAAL